MFGWSISASACRSASNRARTCLRIHARFDELQRDQTLDRLDLLRHEHGPHSTFADRLEQLVTPADNRFRSVGGRVEVGRLDGAHGQVREAFRLRMGQQ